MSTFTIQISPVQVGEQEALDDIRSVISQDRSSIKVEDLREITESTAATVASWYQSSGSVGSVLASFASGSEVDAGILMDDIHSTRMNEGYFSGSMDEEQKNALDCLSTFVLNRI